MATYDYTWKVTDFDANTGICYVTYTPKDKKLTEKTSSFKIAHEDELEAMVLTTVPVQDWHREKNQIDANTIIGMTGENSAEVNK
jgi:hypothetical protein